ncbi:MFS transporter [Conexibacter sp. SYSU D00693]|uniref:MFS transporter n=1 Tax=Conexibacter sp. SYSU D00693 TaxID=2812560 RepID=UPI00196B76D1|nr:MFS transporter [Conexibacter sp. SYSU D00693]
MSRDLRLLTAATFLSATGDLLALIVLGLAVHDLTGSGFAVAGLVATTLMPAVLLAPLAGRVVDRHESVRVLVLASLAQAAVAVGLAFAVDDLAGLLVLCALLAAGNAVAQPAEFTLVPAVAASGRLAEATGAVEAARYAGFAVGPLLAAVLATAGATPALLVNAVSFVAIAVAAGALRARRPGSVEVPGDGPAAYGGLAGLRVLLDDRVLRVVVGATTGALLVLSATLTVEVFFVKDVVGANDAGYAVVVCGWMAGMVCGATAVAPRVPATLVAGGALVALAVQGGGLALQTTWTILPVAVAGYAVGGVGHGAKNVLVRTLMTVRVPEARHGRAFAAYGAARNAAELVAVAGGGVLVGAVGPRAALVVAGAVPVLAAVAGLARLSRRRRWADARGSAHGPLHAVHAPEHLA